MRHLLPALVPDLSVAVLQRFSAVIMRIRDPKTTALIFASGKVVSSDWSFDSPDSQVLYALETTGDLLPPSYAYSAVAVRHVRWLICVVACRL